jgi:hypothetical protein
MKRLLTILAAMALALVLAPVALAADEVPADGQVLVSFNGPLEVPAGQHVEAVIVLGGDAVIAGEVDALVVIGGDATLTGARVDSIAMVDGDVTIDSASVVTGDIRTLSGSAIVAPGAEIGGDIKGLEGDLATLGFVVGPIFVLFAIGVALVTLVVALAVAALGARQVRTAETLISRQPGSTIVAGLIGVVLVPLFAALSIVTIIGAPIGLAVLLFVLPTVAYFGWIVAAIWTGDWLLMRHRGPYEAERPYQAAVLGVIVLGLVGIVPVAGPIVGAIASLFGYGSLLLLAWRTFRHEPLPPMGIATPSPMAA